jgi:hypothetical protein
MLPYDMPLFRPPSEGRSVIIQATLGCSHNACSFCAMYRTKRFTIRPFEAVAADIDAAARLAPGAAKVFLADGDALVIPTERLLPILAHVTLRFPGARVTSYATPRNLCKKSPHELRRLRDAGLDMVYLGVETGDPLLLAKITKGATREDILAGAANAHAAGLRISATVILGLGGRAHSGAHAEHTATLLTAMKPAFASALVLMLPAPVADEFHAKFAEPFEPLDVPGVLDETERLVRGIDAEGTVFRSNHASNYLPIGGTLNGDREALVAAIARARADIRHIRPEWSRGL